MSLNFRQLLILSLISVILLLTFGCSQHDDIIQPQNRASIILRPYNLPVLDEDYAYELWVLAIDGSDSTFTSMGKFLWDNYNVRFTDLSSNPIDSVYEVPGNWNDHDYIVVTIENRNDIDPDPSGSIMLIDEIIDPSTRPISLRFPGDFSLTTGYYFVASPSDDNDNVDEQKGIWVCARAESQRQLQDTVGIRNYDTTHTQQANSDTRKPTDPDTVGILGYTVINDDMVIIGYDTILNHRRIEIEWEIMVDTLKDYLLFVNYDTLQSITHYYYNYAGPLEELPDLQPYGWRYNTWVFHEYPPEVANLPKMVPFGFERQKIFVADTNWHVLALGAFFDPTQPDLSNPFTHELEVPQFPGEDFIVNAGDLSGIDFRYDEADPTGGEWGSVVIGMEPIPDPSRINVDTSKNFPLFVMSDFLRSASHLWVDPTPGGDTTVKLNDVAWVHAFHNWSQFLPEIRLEVIFHE